VHIYVLRESMYVPDNLDEKINPHGEMQVDVIVVRRSCVHEQVNECHI